MMNNMEQQVNQFRQHSAQMGFSGTAILDVHPSSGIIRLKLNSNPPESLQPFTTNYAGFLKMSLNAMNVEVKMHIAEEGK